MLAAEFRSAIENTTKVPIWVWSHSPYFLDLKGISYTFIVVIFEKIGHLTALHQSSPIKLAFTRFC